MTDLSPEYWKNKPLEALDQVEWEALCDGCAKCCLFKLEDSDSGEVCFTNVHCRLLDTETGKCTDYANRSTLVPDCVSVTLELLKDPYWLPATCAYRRLAEGKDLPLWHPLVTGDKDSVYNAGHSILGRSVCEDEADDLESHLITWVY